MVVAAGFGASRPPRPYCVAVSCRRLVSAVAFVCLVVATGCATRVGSRSLPRVRGSYNVAVSQSADQQMLLNIVRLRYLHSTTFLQLSSVTTQFALTNNAGVSGGYNPGAAGPVPAGTVGGSAGVTMTERPTITYTPLQGEAFVRRLATPLTHDQVLLVLRAGWGADLVLATCIRQINDVYAPTFSEMESEGDFRRLGELLNRLQLSHELLIEDEGMRARSHAAISVGQREEGTLSAEAREVLELLGLSPELSSYRVSGVSAQRMPGTISIRARSVLGTMFYLSQGVEVPEGDDAARDLGGPESLADPRLHVRTSDKAPKHAYVAVEYRDRWFYIDETDHGSKRAFVLLSFLFNLTSAPSAGGPVLTVGAGG